MPSSHIIIGKEDAHAAAMKVGDHLSNAFDAAGHGLDHLELVAVVDAHVGVGRPDEDGVDSAIAFFEIVEVAIDGVTPGQLGRRSSDRAPSSAAA